MEFTYQIIKKPKKRNATISISPDNSVKISVPYFLSNQAIEKLVQAKKAWIIKKIKENSHKIAQIKPKNFVSGETLVFLGQNYELSISFSNKSKVTLEGNILKVETNIFTKAQIKKLIEKWYINEAKRIFMNRAQHFSQIICNNKAKRPEGLLDFLFLNTNKKENYFYNKITIKNVKSRWGSCSRKKNLNFNWKLVLAPLEILDYVVVHELCHLEHLNHSKAFWALVRKIIPTYDSRRKWLKNNGCFLNL